MAPHMVDSMAPHECGGAILSDELDGEEYYYCHRCGAFTYGGSKVPSGTDERANRNSWDDGEFCSPDADAREVAE